MVPTVDTAPSVPAEAVGEVVDVAKLPGTKAFDATRDAAVGVGRVMVLLALDSTRGKAWSKCPLLVGEDGSVGAAAPVGDDTVLIS